MPHKVVVRGGVNIPSVTQIIGCLDVLEKQGLYNWYAKYGLEECNRIKNESASFGTAVHMT